MTQASHKPGGTAAAQASRVPGRVNLSKGLFVAHTLPGAEKIACEELAAEVPGFREAGKLVVPARNTLVFFEAAALPDVQRLRTLEDLFSLVARQNALSPGRRGLAVAASLARESRIDAALDLRAAVCGRARTGRTLTFRVIARMVGRTGFKRIEIEHAVTRGILSRRDRRWIPVSDRADVEFWTTVNNRQLALAVRLTDAQMRHRTYQTVDRAAALRPSLAATLAHFSQPTADDVVLDPMCGSGTILIERAHVARYRQLLGGDKDPAALAAARANIGPRYKPIELKLWDATALPLADSSADRIITNLPWGRKSPFDRAPGDFYRQLLKEFLRVVKRGGLIVVMSGIPATLLGAIRGLGLKPEKTLSVTVLGHPALAVAVRA